MTNGHFTMLNFQFTLQNQRPSASSATRAFTHRKKLGVLPREVKDWRRSRDAARVSMRLIFYIIFTTDCDGFV
jgi:hypothetical protein